MAVNPAGGLNNLVGQTAEGGALLGHQYIVLAEISGKLRDGHRTPRINPAVGMGPGDGKEYFLPSEHMGHVSPVVQVLYVLIKIVLNGHDLFRRVNIEPACRCESKPALAPVKERYYNKETQSLKAKQYYK